MKYLSILITILLSYVCYSQNNKISVGSSWKYYDQGDVGTANWIDNNFDDSMWSSGNAELGYGDGDEATTVSFGGNSSNKHITTYFRKAINLTEQRGINCRIKVDDGAVVYLNGNEVFRNNMPSGVISYATLASSNGDESGWTTFTLPLSASAIGSNTFAVEIHQVSATSSDISFDFEAILQPPPPPPGLYINEVMASNSETADDQAGESSDWIEILNATSSTLDLNGYYFTDDSTELTKFQISGSLTVPAFGRMVLWASGDPARGTDHIGFSLSASGEFIGLIEPNGTTVTDSMSFTKQRTDVSFGRETDGSTNLRFFSPASFNTSNNAADAYLGILEPPVFSHQGGFYQNPFDLTLTTNESGATIYYSTDGSEPEPQKTTPQTYNYKQSYPEDPGDPFSGNQQGTYQCFLYQNPVSISDRNNESNKISNINSTWQFSPNYIPTYKVPKASIVRARVVKQSFLPSDIKGSTYFFSAAGFNNTSIPILSFQIQENHLFGREVGLYVAGFDFEHWRSQNLNTPLFANTPANWQRRGSQDFLPASLEILEGNNSVFNREVRAKIHGNTSRRYSNKSLRLNDIEDANYSFIPARGNLNYNSIILRNSGQDVNITHMHDAIIQRVFSKLNFDIQEYQPVIHFINGEYWGILNLRDRQNLDFYSSLYGLETNEIEILGTGGIFNSSGEYGVLISYVENNPMTSATDYDYVDSKIDLSSFIDYQIAEIFSANIDWPYNNIKYWRRKIPYDSTEPQGRDGRWRWSMNDLDQSFGFGTSNVNLNTLEVATRSNEWYSTLFHNLLKNDTFKNDFLTRTSDLYNSHLQTSHVSQVIHTGRDIISPYILEHMQRWGRSTTLTAWNSKLDELITFSANRRTVLKSHLSSKFNLTGEFDLTVNVSDESAGYVHVNSIDILSSTPGINANPYPWTGEYFDNIPLKIHARPNIGYKFKHWEYNGTTITDSVLTLNTSSDVSYKAIFEEDLLSENPAPTAFNVDKCGYNFNFWDSEADEATFPASMAFVYMDEEDPTLSANIAGFTSGDYDNSSRTRVNGLGSNGASFINTGSGRDGYPETKVGGAIMSLNTTNYDSLSLSFTAGTVTSNSREYNLRLQYRIGDKLPFTDFLDENNQVVEYTRSTTNGDEQHFEVNLPASIIGKSYVQLFWRYYFTDVRNSESSGARDEIRLDDVKISAKLLIDQPVLISETYNKYGEITARSNIDPNTSLTLEAGRSIIIQPGFSANNQTVFTAIVTGCPE